MGVMAKKPYRMNSPLKTLGQMLINRLGGFMGNTAKSGTSLLAGSLQSVPKQRGIVFNADTNTVTNYGSGKSEKILHLQGDVDQDKINELVAGKNYERIVNYAKHNGNFKSETLLDVSGKEIYSAVNVGQNGKGIDRDRKSVV